METLALPRDRMSPDSGNWEGRSPSKLPQGGMAADAHPPKRVSRLLFADEDPHRSLTLRLALQFGHSAIDYHISSAAPEI